MNGMEHNCRAMGVNELRGLDEEVNEDSDNLTLPNIPGLDYALLSSLIS